MSQQPDAAARLRALLSSMGVDDYEPRVVHQLLEFQQSYLTEIFADGAMYADHAGRPGQLECEDVHLATRLRAASSQAVAPKLLECIAEARNSARIKNDKDQKPGVQLPEPSLCLVQENWQYLLPPAPAPDKASDAAAPSPASVAAPHGKRIAINLSSSRPGGPAAMALG